MTQPVSNKDKQTRLYMFLTVEIGEFYTYVPVDNDHITVYRYLWFDICPILTPYTMYSHGLSSHALTLTGILSRQ